MATVDQIAIARLDALIERANTTSSMSDRDPAAAPELAALRAQSLSAVAAIAGSDSAYHAQIEAAYASAYSGLSSARFVRAILGALRDDLRAGYFQRAADLLAAEIFGDFLAMARHLVDAGYHIPAASLIGAVLEDGLRRLVLRSGVSLLSSDDISSLNNRLASKKAYSNLVRKQVDVWGAIRNAADHGNFAEVKAGDVGDMLEGVSRFLAERLG